MGFDAWIQLLKVVYIFAEDLHILQPIRSCGSASEGKDGSAAL